MESTKNEFLNKRIVVTGASSGIGQAVATYFLNSGALVVLAGQDLNSMKKVCEKFPEHATLIRVNLVEDINLFDIKSSIVERLGNIDILVNCAGVKFDGDIEKTFPQDFDYTVDLNVRSVFILIKYLKSYFNPNASIINVSCLYGTRPFYGMISHCMSKAGLETLTRYAAAELAPLNIRVNAVSACPVDTNSLRMIGITEPEIAEYNEKMKKNVPMGRIAYPSDVAKTIVFLASTRSSKITGQIIKVDGGRSLTSSGYVHYKGMKNMNARFEPDGVIMSQWVDNWTKKIISPQPVVYPTDPIKLEQFVEEKIQASNFSTRLISAHVIVNAQYKTLYQNDEKLKEKYVQKDQSMNQNKSNFI